MQTMKEYLGRARSYIWDKLGIAGDYNDRERLNEIWGKMKPQLLGVMSEVKDKGSSAFVSVIAFVQEQDLLQWTKSLTEGAATAYDQAMDQIGKVTRIQGPEHRLFDAGHTVWGSWKAAKEAAEREGDNITERVIGWTEAYLKDLTTPMGMPFVTIDKDNFQSWVDKIVGTFPALDRGYVYDLLTFDAMEICAAGLSVVGVFFAFTKNDKEKVAEILGAMGISSIMAANPILGLITITVTAYSYWKHGPVDTASVVKGGGLTAISALMFSIMGLPILVELVIVVVLTILLRKYIVDNKEFASWLKGRIQDSLSGPRKLLNLERLQALASALGAR